MTSEQLFRHGSKKIGDMLGSMDDNVQVTLHQEEKISLMVLRHLEVMHGHGGKMQKLLEMLSGLHRRSERLLSLPLEDEQVVMVM